MDPTVRRTYAVHKALSDSLLCCREITHERKSPLMPQTSLLSYFENLHCYAEHADQSAAVLAEATSTSRKITACSRLSWWLPFFFSYKYFLTKVCMLLFLLDIILLHTCKHNLMCTKKPQNSFGLLYCSVWNGTHNVSEIYEALKRKRSMCCVKKRCP